MKYFQELYNYKMLFYVVVDWNSIIINGSWKGETAGGCHDYPTFTDNPQYVVELHEDADGDGKCSILIALMQKNLKRRRKMGMHDLRIGYAIYKVDALTISIITFSNRPQGIRAEWMDNMLRVIIVWLLQKATLIVEKCLTEWIYHLVDTSSSLVPLILRKKEISC